MTKQKTRKKKGKKQKEQNVTIEGLQRVNKRLRQVNKRLQGAYKALSVILQSKEELLEQERKNNKSLQQKVQELEQDVAERKKREIYYLREIGEKQKQHEQELAAKQTEVELLKQKINTLQEVIEMAFKAMLSKHS